MLKERCDHYREIEFANALLEDLILKKYCELKNNKDNKIKEQYRELKAMRNNLLDKNVRTQVIELAEIEMED